MKVTNYITSRLKKTCITAETSGDILNFTHMGIGVKKGNIILYSKACINWRKDGEAF